MAPFQQHPPDADQGAAIGWISIADLFLLVAVILITTVGLYQSQLTAAQQQLLALKADGGREALVEELNRSREEAARIAAERDRIDKQRLAAEKEAARIAADRDRIDKQRLAAEKEAARIAADRDRIDKVRLVAEKEAARIAADRDRIDKQRLASDAHLADLAQKVRTYESRFEGLRLAGHRVVFLVDRSGSMGYVDERTPDPKKWQIVSETVRRIMRSLPETRSPTSASRTGP